MVEPDRSQTHCMLNNKGYRRTRGICTTYCFSTATMVTLMRCSVAFICTTLHVLIDSTADYRRLFDATGSIFIYTEKSVSKYVFDSTCKNAARLRFGG